MTITVGEYKITEGSRETIYEEWIVWLDKQFLGYAESIPEARQMIRDHQRAQA